MFQSLIMDRRYVFPVVMFVLAGVSFTYGIYEHFAATGAQTSADARMAFILSSIENSRSSRQEKQDLYTTIFKGLPAAPSILGVGLSGSSAAPVGGDQCVNDGQRAVCGALKRSNTDAATTMRICGLCSPK